MTYQDIEQCYNMKQYAVRNIGQAFSADTCRIIATVITVVISVTVISVTAVVCARSLANCVDPLTDGSRASVDAEKAPGIFITTFDEGGDNLPTVHSASAAVTVEGVEQDLAPTVSTAVTRQEDLQLRLQLEELSAVGCRPTRQVINVMTLLKPEDDLLDKISNPQWVVVGNCLPTCSYCGSGHRCLPAPGGEHKKMFIVYVRGEDGKPVFHRRYVVEHTACSCQPL